MNNMSHSLEIKIHIVLFVAKFESPIIVIREVKQRGTTNILTSYTITSIYQTFLETGSGGDNSQTGRS